jgi:organic radical activating enzyme
MPSVFIRLATCNLRCTWCDTAYTWDWTRYDAGAQVIHLAPADIFPLVAATKVQNAVITGGEPLLQQRGLGPLAAALKAASMRIEVETNGTLTPSLELIDLVDQWNVSPKLSNSANAPSARENGAALRTFASLSTAYFKFVVVETDDLQEVGALVQRYAVPPAHTFLMPEATDADTLRQRSRWLAELCTTSGYRFGPRLHIELWGNERGR